MAATQVVMFLLLIMLSATLQELNLDYVGAGIIALALTFSSTVFVIQTMQ